jgi:hypothetical protein
LGDYGFDKNEIERIVQSTSCKYNPIKHAPEELAGMLERRI